MSDDVLDRLKTALADRYDIERELGRGGMATVYVAEDLKHHRKVAVKVLHPELAAVVGAERFLKEIEVTANLQHPHILPLHDSGEAKGLVYYVMPYLEGVSLREKLEREKELSISETIEITKAVASALDYAHRHNVIHRDIKPENILLQDGQPVVADFGIALAVSAAGGTRLTETGLSIGTPQYMSPEQAMGDRELDGRSDVYSLGCVVYEMLVGEPPYTGPTAQAIVAKVLTEDAKPVTASRKTVPTHVDLAIQKALAKLPADRFVTAAAFAEALAGRREVDAQLATRRPAVPAPSPRSKLTSLLPWGAVAALGLVVVWLLTRPVTPTVTGAKSLNIALPASAPLVFVGEAAFGIGQPALALSPDGSLLAFVGRAGETTRLYVRPIDDFEARPLPGTEAAYGPFFSPDGQWIAFFVENQLMRVSVDGDQVLPIAEVNDPAGGSWSEDDRIVAVENDGTRLVVVSPGGRQVEDFRAADRAYFPQWLPGGEWVLHHCSRPELLCVTSVKTKEVRHLTTTESELRPSDQPSTVPGSNPRYLPTGYIIFSAPTDNVLLGVRFDAERLRVEGEPVALVHALRREAAWGAIQVTVSASGDLVYATGSNSQAGTLVWTSRDGTIDTLPFPTRVYGDFALSPDGRRVAAAVAPPTGPAQLWFLDLELGRERRWAAERAVFLSARWDASSRWVAARGTYGSRAMFRRVDAVAASLGDTLYDGPAPPLLEALLPDGRLLLSYQPPGSDNAYLTALTEEELAVLDTTASGRPSRLIAAPGRQWYGRLSPDGRWLAYTSTESGRYEVYAVRFPVTGPSLKLSISGGEEPEWSPRGDGLFYRDGQRWYWVRLLDSGDRPFAEPELFLEGDFLNVRGAEYAVSPDGQRLLLLQGPGERTTTTLNVVTNWFHEVGQRLRTQDD